jgi:hypothetical protein
VRWLGWVPDVEAAQESPNPLSPKIKTPYIAFSGNGSWHIRYNMPFTGMGFGVHSPLPPRIQLSPFLLNPLSSWYSQRT